MIRVNLNKSGNFTQVMFNKSEELSVRYNVFKKKHEYVSRFGNEYVIEPQETPYVVNIKLVGEDKSVSSKPKQQQTEKPQETKQSSKKQKQQQQQQAQQEVEKAEAANVDDMLAAEKKEEAEKAEEK